MTRRTRQSDAFYEALKARAVKLARNGMTCSAIARELDTTRVTVTKWLRAAGVRARALSPRTTPEAAAFTAFRRGASLEEIARVLGVSAAEADEWINGIDCRVVAVA